MGIAKGGREGAKPPSQLKCHQQRWSPRGRPWLQVHILKSLVLASKPQVLENCSVLGSRTALFFESLKFCWKTPETLRKTLRRPLLFSSLEIAWKIFWRPFFSFFFWDHLKNFLEDFFFLENTCACVLGLSIPVLSLERVCPLPCLKFFFVSLASSLVSSTPVLATSNKNKNNEV